MNEMRLHHVGVVVADLAASLESYARSLGARWDSGMFTDPYQKVKVGFVTTNARGAQIELVQPDAPDSPVARFLTERGGGLHHVCYEVDNLDEGLAQMRAQGAVIAKRPKPAVAFDGRRIAWVITAEKLLVELLERGEPPWSKPPTLI